MNVVARLDARLHRARTSRRSGTGYAPWILEPLLPEGERQLGGRSAVQQQGIAESEPLQQLAPWLSADMDRSARATVRLRPSGPTATAVRRERCGRNAGTCPAISTRGPTCKASWTVLPRRGQRTRACGRCAPRPPTAPAPPNRPDATPSACARGRSAAPAAAPRSSKKPPFTARIAPCCWRRSAAVRGASAPGTTTSAR